MTTENMVILDIVTIEKESQVKSAILDLKAVFHRITTHCRLLYCLHLTKIQDINTNPQRKWKTLYVVAQFNFLGDTRQATYKI